ncbi:endochitinase EP3-like [Olea europaea var. sylvestris]|uniref:endochitinase EP3-like n=1 Tax=Olea europaea var. sylvestris TaxID=158386 RepID=UPI000C1D33AF|nr:endochitinase EP3-like [Olea europaea var. sylvestris]
MTIAAPCCAPPTSNGVSISKIMTNAFFNGTADRAAVNCAKSVFTQRAAFLETLDSKCAIAAFFAHVTHGTGRIIKDFSSFKLFYMRKFRLNSLPLPDQISPHNQSPPFSIPTAATFDNQSLSNLFL